MFSRPRVSSIIHLYAGTYLYTHYPSKVVKRASLRDYTKPTTPKSVMLRHMATVVVNA